MAIHARLTSTLLTLVAGGALLMLSTASTSAQPAGGEKVKALLKKRLAVYVKIEEITRQSYVAGRATLREVVDAQASLLRAKLDVCETKEERIKACEDMVKLAQILVDRADARLKVALDGTLELLRAQAHLLDARISLERAKENK